MFCTNSKTPLKIELDDRRFCVINMLNTYKNNKTYYSKLVEIMKNPIVLSAWYDYLMSLDVDKFDFVNGRPKSKLYNEIVEACASNVTKFMAYLLDGIEEDDEKVMKCTASKLFKTYNDWKTSTNHKDEHNTTSFGREVANICGITKSRVNTGVQYVIDFDKLKEHFGKNNLFGQSKSSTDVNEVDKLNAIIARLEQENKNLLKLLEKKQTTNIYLTNNNYGFGKLTSYDYETENEQSEEEEEEEEIEKAPKKKSKTGFGKIKKEESTENREYKDMSDKKIHMCIDSMELFD